MDPNNAATPTPNVSELAKLYQVYKQFVQTPAGKPPFWFTAAEIRTFRDIHATLALRDAMEDLARDLARRERIAAAGTCSTDDLLLQLDEAPFDIALCAYGVWKARQLFHDEQQQIDYVQSFDVLADMLGELAVSRPQAPFPAEGRKCAEPAGFTEFSVAANDGVA